MIDFIELRLHLGAHKTATTHFQDLLEKNVEHLRKLNCLYIPRNQFRKNRIIKKLCKKYVMSQNKLVFWRRQPTLNDIMLESGDDIKRILISEENLLGSVRSLLTGSYSELGARLKPWTVLASQENVKLFLSIRSYSEILPSAYSQAIRNGARINNFEEYLDGWMNGSFSWVKLIANIRTYFPKSSITIWTFEDYIEDHGRFLEIFTGEDIPQLELTVPQDTTRLSGEQLMLIKTFLIENPKLYGKPLREKIKNIIKESKVRGKYTPLSELQKKVLFERYCEDLETIRKSDAILV